MATAQVQPVQFIEAGHRYVAPGEIEIPSVSAIIAGCNLSNYGTISEVVLKKKSELGTAVHKACHYYDENDLDLDSLDQRVRRRLEGWIKFRKDYDFNPVLLETAMMADYFGMKYGMTPDRVGTGKFGPKGEYVEAVVDIKNTAEIEPHHRIQLAAYALPFKTETVIPKRYVVQLFDDAPFYKAVEFTNRMDEKVFLSALVCEWWKRNERIK